LLQLYENTIGIPAGDHPVVVSGELFFCYRVACFFQVLVCFICIVYFDREVLDYPFATGCGVLDDFVYVVKTFWTVSPSS